MTVQQFKLPDLGEGLTEGDILKWTVAVGDTVDVNDTIAEVETVKAAVELPSPWAGVVTALHAAEGETVPVGTPIISIDTAGGEDISRPAAAAAAATEDLVPGLPGETGSATPAEEKQMTLVGYGPREETGGRRRRRPAATAAGTQTAFNVPPGSAAHQAPPPEIEEPAEPVRGRAAAHRVLAKPPVRKLAKTLGVDLTAVTPTGPDGTISRDDVQSAANGAQPSAAPRHGARETRVPIKSVRKHMAAAMVASAFSAPHVTEFLTCDVTAMMDLRDRIAARRDFAGVKVSPLVLVARAAMIAMRNTPEINATWDDAAGEVVLKHYVNLGIAAATDRGLVVPNIKDADQLTLRELAGAIGTLTETARAGKTAPADMTGGSFTITNVGVFGVDTGTPIINPGESAILAFGAVRRMPWVVGTGSDERIEPRWVTQLAVSFDHRLVDGHLGSRFLAELAAILTDPGLALL
jgi:pyruvate dehydrogenase E2 component (dihydrolipoamide acetyltransferase)